MCDIDRCKTISEALRSFVQDHGMLVARHGGEEFDAIVRVANFEQATEYAEALRKACIKDIAGAGETGSAHEMVSSIRRMSGYGTSWTVKR
jgi:GGDEF domain-containing protein